MTDQRDTKKYKKIQINLNNIETEAIDSIVSSINAGKVVMIPTDTCYGLAASALNKNAVNKIYRIKQRSLDKQISYIFKNLDQISCWADLKIKDLLVLNQNLPGAFTFILNIGRFYEGPTSLSKTLGARIPDFKFTNMLSQKLEHPYSATSANLASKPECYSVDDFLKQLESEEHPIYPDIIVDAGKLEKRKPSTVVDLTTNKIRILREGSGDLVKTTLA